MHPEADEHQETSLSAGEKTRLLRLARESLADLLGEAPAGPEAAETPRPPEALQAQRGCFVSLHTGSRLRGCIGTLSSTTPLFETVPRLARAAAAQDYRFAPVTARELEDLRIEISVLGPLVAIDSLDRIQVGRHGLVVGRGECRGVLLPQVAAAENWDAETFLSRTCAKAGLPAGCWRAWAAGRDRDLKVEIFTAQVFAEDEEDEPPDSPR
ncbi:MAG: AmmeMemoRadiSam system protein A [Acidobacteriota bacterium]